MKIGFALAGVLHVVLGSWTLLGQQPGATSPASAITNPIPSTEKSIDSGRKLFERYCRPCHGENAQGDGPLAPKDIHPPNLADDDWAHGSTDGEIFMNIRNGIAPKFDMKPWKSKVTDAETWNIVNYLRSLSASDRK